jgi:hypothetical protein
MKFHPQSSEWVAVATAKVAWMRRYHFPSNNIEGLDYFGEEIKNAHDQHRVRSLCFSPTGDFLATVGMNNGLTIWYVSLKSSPDDPKPHRKWILIRKEIFGIDDPLDVSCQPCFISDTLLVVASTKHIYIRSIHERSAETGPQWTVLSQEEIPKFHTKSIARFAGYDHDFFVTAGQDSRIVVWGHETASNLHSKVSSYTVLTL